MDNISENIKQFLDTNKMTIDEFSKKVKIESKNIEQLLLGKYTPTKEEVSTITKFISNDKMSSGRRCVRAIELIFKFGACIMALVTLLLCIMGSVEVETLIALLSIGLVCATIPSLPKIDK